MFVQRINKVTLRRRFEERVWHKGEIFRDYLHDKEILASCVPIEREELIDYVVEGIPDPFLRDQARIQRFDSTAEILRAFENVGLSTRSQRKDLYTDEAATAKFSRAGNGIKDDRVFATAAVSEVTYPRNAPPKKEVLNASVVMHSVM